MIIRWIKKKLVPKRDINEYFSKTSSYRICGWWKQLTQKRKRRNQELGITLWKIKRWHDKSSTRVRVFKKRIGQDQAKVARDQRVTTLTVRSDTPLSANSSSYRTTCLVTETLAHGRKVHRRTWTYIHQHVTHAYYEKMLTSS